MTAAQFPVQRSLLTCPACGARSEEVMPTDACIHFHRCSACGTMLHPLPGHCCVFCSYGSVPCPPVQLASQCGTGTACGVPRAT